MCFHMQTPHLTHADLTWLILTCLWRSLSMDMCCWHITRLMLTSPDSYWHVSGGLIGHVLLAHHPTHADFAWLMLTCLWRSLSMDMCYWHLTWLMLTSPDSCWPVSQGGLSHWTCAIGTSPDSCWPVSQGGLSHWTCAIGTSLLTCLSRRSLSMDMCYWHLTWLMLSSPDSC